MGGAGVSTSTSVVVLLDIRQSRRLQSRLGRFADVKRAAKYRLEPEQLRSAICRNVLLNVLIFSIAAGLSPAGTARFVAKWAGVSDAAPFPLQGRKPLSLVGLSSALATRRPVSSRFALFIT